MLSRIVALTMLVLPFLVVATPTNTAPNKRASQCKTDSFQCCSFVVKAGSATGVNLLGMLSIVPEDSNVLLGLDCSPIRAVGVVGVSGNSCSANPVCCENNAVGNLISIGCVPVDLGL